MSSSESEAFESADEDYDVADKDIKSASKEKPNTSNKPKSPTVKSKIPVKPVKDDSKLQSDIEKSTETNKEESEKPSQTIKEKAPEPQPAESKTDDGWDLDDWGATDPPAEDKVNPSTKQSNEDDGDGWDDFDDWGENNEPTKAQTDKHLKSVFPVLDDISPTKETAKPFSKNVEQPQVSTYDTFPVLNDLSSNRRQNAPPKTTSTPEVETMPEKDEQKPAASSWGGWKPWGGVVSLISTATEGVSSLTSHVSQGLSTVIGVPDPEEMAKIHKENEKRMKELGLEDDKEDNTKESPTEDILRNSFGTIVSGVTQIGNKVITGGLDTLEGIGKKTMTILQENDPLLLNKRKFLGLDSDKPVLSQMLREAKEKSEETEKNLKQMQKHMYRKQLHFETLFDHYHGLVHLEALEMLSKQSSIKLQSLLEPLTGKALLELEETLNEVKELCDLGDIETDDADGMYAVDVLEEKFSDAIEDLGVEVDLKDLLKCWTTNTDWLNDNPNPEAQEVYDKALKCLAETCALAVNKMHKIAELLLIKDHHSTANEADSLVQLTTAFCWHLSGIANRFGGKLNSFETSEEISSLITSIFLEVSNSTSYIQSAFQLFIPILQIGAA